MNREVWVEGRGGGLQALLAPFPVLSGVLFDGRDQIRGERATLPGPPLLWKEIRMGASECVSVQRPQPSLGMASSAHDVAPGKVGEQEGGTDEEGS